MKTVRKFAETLTCPRINISHTHCEVINLFPVKKKKKKAQSLSAAQASPALKSIKANALSLIYSHITHVVAVSRAS